MRSPSAAPATSADITEVLGRLDNVVRKPHTKTLNCGNAATLSRAVAGAARRGHVTAIVRNVCSGRGSGGDGGYVPVGADAHGCAVLQQQERHVIVGVTAGVLVYGSHQGAQCLIALRCEKRRCDRVFREEVPAGVAAFDKPVGVEQQPVAGRPGRGESGEAICKAERRGGLAVGQRPQVAAVAQQRRVMAAVDNGQLASGGDLRQRCGDEVLLAQVRPDGLADLARHLL